ncbi:MAG: YheT family hydrolase [bacterium]
MEKDTEIINFKPHPLILGGHLQTIIGYYLPGPRQLVADKIHRVQVSDGDRLAVCENRPGQELAVRGGILFMHGLGGQASSPYMLRLAKLFKDRGWVTFRMNHRGCGEGVGLARNLYHSGRSDDVSQVLKHIAKLAPNLPLIAVGFSLSGNTLLKLLGEQNLPIPDNLCSAMAVSPPIELSRCAAALCLQRNRIYDIRFVRLLKQSIKERQLHFPDFPSFRFPWNMTVRQFDEICTAPLNNFKSAEDYYSKCSAKQFLSGISIPTVLIASDDDPFIPEESFAAVPENHYLKLHLTHSGGHMGFVCANKTPLGNHRWMDYAVLTISERLIKRNRILDDKAMK